MSASLSRIVVRPGPGTSASHRTWRFRGQLYVTAVVKGTFSFKGTDGAAMAWVDPLPISERSSAETVPARSGADVLMSGHACAPLGRATTSVEVCLEVLRGADRVLFKAVTVTGAPDARGAPAPFAVMALPADAGFGPAPTFAHEALDRRPEPHEVADSASFASFNAAPPDQRLANLRGDERIVVTGTHPTARRIAASLPSPRASARLGDLHRLADVRAFDLVADMLVLDTDKRLCSVVWRGHLPVPATSTELVLEAWIDVPGQRPAGRNRPPAIEPLDPTAATLTLTPELAAKSAGAAALPFGAAPAQGFDTRRLSADEVEVLRRAAPMPFVSGAADPGISTGRAWPPEHVDTGTVTLSRGALAPLEAAVAAAAATATTADARRSEEALPRPEAASPPRGTAAQFLAAGPVSLEGATDDLPPP
jgi:hypothetical protein